MQTFVKWDIINTMNRKITACALACAFTVAALPLTACNRERAYGVYLYAMNTDATLSAAEIEQTEFDELAEMIADFLTAADLSVSASNEQSCIYKFNVAEAGARVEIDETAYEMLSLAASVYTETGGCYNPAVWYSEDLYGFAARSKNEPVAAYYREKVDTDTGYYIPLPEDKYVTAFCDLASHFNEMTLEEKEGKYYAVKPEYTVTVEGDPTVYSMRLDLGGIAKGWCADRVMEMMNDAGISYGYFSFGGSSMGLKKYAYNDTGDYQIFAGDPRRKISDDYLSFYASDVSYSTSGDNLNYYMVDGVRYCHIIDPQTGSPVNNGIASVTLVCDSAGRADALSTALLAMSKTDAVKFINDNLANCSVFMLFEEESGCRIITNRPDDITVENADYTVGNTVTDGKIILT